MPEKPWDACLFVITSIANQGTHNMYLVLKPEDCQTPTSCCAHVSVRGAHEGVGLLVQHPSLRLAMEDFRGAWGGETFVCLLHGCMLVNSHPAYGLSTRRSRVCRMSKLDLRFRAFRVKCSVPRSKMLVSHTRQICKPPLLHTTPKQNTLLHFPNHATN